MGIIFHLIFEILAYYLGYRYYSFLRKKSNDKISDRDRISIFIAGCLGAVIFSKFIAIMDHWHLIDSNTPIAFYFLQKTIVGGLFGGLLGIEIIKKFLSIKYSSGDLMTYPLILGIGVGRIGCFLAGTNDGTHGSPTDFLLGYDFGDGVKRHPTQAYEIFFLLNLFIFLQILEYLILHNKFPNSMEKLFTNENQLIDGLKFKIFLFSYFSFRFFIEFIKPVAAFQFGLTFIQLTCLVGILYYVFLTFRFFVRRFFHA